MMFKYLSKNEEMEIVVEKSRFITYFFSINSQEEALKLINEIREKHPKANHHCTAYLLDNHKIQKYNDDGEPSKTAGFPMIDVLIKNDLDDILAVVVRYFGGIKLGAGGLTRTYRKCVADLIKEIDLVERIELPVYQIKVPYSLNDSINYLLKNESTIINIDYQENVVYKYYTYNHDLENSVIELTSGIKPVVVNTIKVVNKI